MKLPYSGYLKRPNGPMLLCYISSRRQFSGGPEEQIRRLLNKIEECIAAGIDYIQLREKDMSGRALENLAAAAAGLFPANGTSRFLINSRVDVALACGAHGVHLPANDLSASEARALMTRGGCARPTIGVSVHSLPLFRRLSSDKVRRRLLCHMSEPERPFVLIECPLPDRL